MSRQPLLLNGETGFITTTVIAWTDVFTNPVYKHIIVDAIRFCQENRGLLIYSWGLMTNHIHLIAGTNAGVAINDLMRDFKKYTSRTISNEIRIGKDNRKNWMLNMFRFVGDCHSNDINYKFWKDDYDCFELNTPEVFDQKMNLIHNNPVKEEIVEEPHHYLYSSARNYAGLPGLLDVIIV
jgi:REP element-mobilizing transposase RayT